MKKISIQTQFLTVIIYSMLIITIVIGGLSIYYVDKFVTSSSEEIMNATCEKEATLINDILKNTEKSVSVMEKYIIGKLESVEIIKDAEAGGLYAERVKNLFSLIAENSDGIVSYYVKYNPEITDVNKGFFVKKIESGKDVELEPTDLSAYDSNDTENVGWYWEPVKAGKPVWMRPYYKRNNKIHIISYVKPLYKDGVLLGVVGMDMDYSAIMKKIDEINKNKRGFAYLSQDDIIVYHKNYKYGTAREKISEGCFEVTKDLYNGMNLVFAEDYSEINKVRYSIGFTIWLVAFGGTLIFILIMIMIVKKIVRPIKKITDAALEISKGNYDIELEYGKTREINTLSVAFEQMVQKLKEHDRQQHILAYRDSLTKLRNSTSYRSWIDGFNKEILNENTEFGVIVLDINDLKMTNDRFGHDVGNKLIQSAAQLIAITFKRSPVFRIGGDEFVVILKDSDLKDCDELMKLLEIRCKNEFIDSKEGKIPVRIASGIAFYDKNEDRFFEDVFRRADENMYETKRKMKAIDKE